jgi:hypothetical protein
LLFRQFERGEISREELHSFLAIHARSLISEMEEARINPIAAYIERLRNHAAARRLLRKHPQKLLRELLGALALIPDFPPAQILWNASHRDVPLHCFFRTRLEPIFRIQKLEVSAMRARLELHYGLADPAKLVRETIILQRDACLVWGLRERFPG